MLHCCSTHDANFFSGHVVSIWNALQSHIVEPPSVSAFRNRLGTFDLSKFDCFQFAIVMYLFLFFLYLGTVWCRLCLPWCTVDFHAVWSTLLSHCVTWCQWM